MNKKYIDFVPTKKANKAVDSVLQEDEPSVEPSVESSVESGVLQEDESSIHINFGSSSEYEEIDNGDNSSDADVDDDVDDELSLEEIFVESEKPAEAPAKPKYGVIEDFKPRFLKTEVQKRPLSHQAKSEDADIDIAKSKKITAKVPFVSRRKPKTVGDIVSPEAKNSAKDKVEPKASSESVDKILDEALSEAEKVTSREKKPVRSTPFVNTEKVEKRPLSRNVYTKKVVVPEEEPSGPVTIIQKPEKDSRIGLVIAIVITIILGATAGTVAFLLLPK